MAALPRPAGVPRWPERTRLPLHDELHARPALAVRPPAVISAWVHWGMRPDAAGRALHALGQGADPPPDATPDRHHRVRGEGFELKFERHGEFVSWQVHRPLADPGEAGGDDERLRTWVHEARALDALPPALPAALQGEGAGEMLAATHVVVVRSQDEQLLQRVRALMGPHLPHGGDDSRPLIGSWIADGRAAVLTDLRLADDGFTRFVLLDFGLPADQAAREAQRLCEIEAYRMLAMLGFPVAQQESQALGDIERQLQQIVDRMAGQDEDRDDALAFDALTRLAAEVEHIAARTRYRFSATRAYHQIVERRLADLRERRLGGMQTLSGFLGRRFAPAMALCESTDARLTDVASRISRAVGLAQVRVESQREATNQHLLAALAHRQQLQLRLQQTVEGLSVVAISYYGLGLLGTLAKAAKAVPGWERLQLQPDLIVGALAVPVVLGVAWSIRRLRHHLGGD